MSSCNFKSQYNVLLSTNVSIRERQWAARTCCYYLCCMLNMRMTVDNIDNMVDFIALHSGAGVSVINNKKVVCDNFELTAKVLTEFRTVLLSKLTEYSRGRKTKKQQGKPFPVQPFYSGENLKLFLNGN